MLITVNDIIKAAESGLKKIPVQSSTVITPAALDMAKELNVILEKNNEDCKLNGTQKQEIDKKEECFNNAVTPDLIARIVREILTALPVRDYLSSNMVKRVDPSGVKVVKGSTVICEQYETGNPNDNIGIKEIFTIRETPNMIAGFMTIEKSTITWKPAYEEIYYVVDGNLEIIINENSYCADMGDVFYLPGSTSVRLSVPSKVKLFFVTYPKRWVGD
ncbi:hypothetical protein [Neomoorella humiferrea]|uniref:hypothetical protein n=1 Tax=Neomoorella humiferrea TaxID=676965 RepID=UPI0030D46A3A